jgi:hypothetical protein
MSETTRESVQQSNGKVETSHHPETDPKEKDKDYYSIPPIKKAHWTWQIPIYFWIGGIAAGVQLFTTLAEVLGHKDQALTRVGRYTALVTMILSPILLIWDLGRPERFYNMMRVWKLRSPMSNQSWALLVYGNLSGLVAARQAAEDGLLGRNFLSRFLIEPYQRASSGPRPAGRPVRRVEHGNALERDLGPDLGAQLGAHGARRSSPRASRRHSRTSR